MEKGLLLDVEWVHVEEVSEEDLPEEEMEEASLVLEEGLIQLVMKNNI